MSVAKQKPTLACRDCTNVGPISAGQCRFHAGEATGGRYRANAGSTTVSTNIFLGLKGFSLMVFFSKK